MKDYIIRFVKSIGVLVPLRTRIIHGMLDYYFIDWIGKDSQYYSLLVIANETQIFTRNILALGESDEPLCDIATNLKQFNNKSDWVIDKWDLEITKKYDAFLKEKLSSFHPEDCNTANYKIISFTVCIRPVLQFVICVEHMSKLDTLVLDCTKSFILQSHSFEETEFLTNVLAELGLINKYTIKEIK